MKHDNSISVRAGWGTEEGRREASRIGGEDGGFSGVTALGGGGGVTHGSKVEQRKAGGVRKNGGRGVLIQPSQ